MHVLSLSTKVIETMISPLARVFSISVAVALATALGFLHFAFSSQDAFRSGRFLHVICIGVKILAVGTVGFPLLLIECNCCGFSTSHLSIDPLSTVLERMPEALRWYRGVAVARLGGEKLFLLVLFSVVLVCGFQTGHCLFGRWCDFSSACLLVFSQGVRVGIGSPCCRNGVPSRGFIF